MPVFVAGAPVTIKSITSATVMALGGEPLGPRFIEWNFVSSLDEGELAVLYCFVFLFLAAARAGRVECGLGAAVGSPREMTHRRAALASKHLASVPP